MLKIFVTVLAATTHPRTFTGDVNGVNMSAGNGWNASVTNAFATAGTEQTGTAAESRLRL